MKYLLKVNSISKSYRKSGSVLKFFAKGQTLALSEVSFAVSPGEIVSVIGHNGAGKTTLFRILAGILFSDSGEVIFNDDRKVGLDFDQRKMIGYVSSDERSFFWRLTGRQNLRFFGGMHGLSKDQVDRMISEKMKLMNFDIDKLFRDYSAGMRKKVAVLRAFLHDPAVLIMDEATNSLDPDSCSQVKELVKSYVRTGPSKAVLWSTHRMEEVGGVCDKVLLLKKGKVQFFGNLEQYEKTCCPRGSYLIRTKAGIDDYDNFRKKIGDHVVVEKVNRDGYTDYVLQAIGQEHFGKAIHIAVKEYDAHIVFAGCVDKELE